MEGSISDAPFGRLNREHHTLLMGWKLIFYFRPLFLLLIARLLFSLIANSSLCSNFCFCPLSQLAAWHILLISQAQTKIRCTLHVTKWGAESQESLCRNKCVCCLQGATRLFFIFKRLLLTNTAISLKSVKEKAFDTSSRILLSKLYIF